LPSAPTHSVPASSTLEKGSSLRLFPLRWPFGSSSLGEEKVRIEDEATRNDAKPQTKIDGEELSEIRPNAYRKEEMTVEDGTRGHVEMHRAEIGARKVVKAHQLAEFFAARRRDEVKLRTIEEQIQKAEENEQRALSELAEVKRQARAQIVKLRAMDEAIRKVKEAEKIAIRELAEERQKVRLETRRMENLRVTQEEIRIAQEAERKVLEEKIRKAEEAEKMALRELANARQQTEHQPKAEGETPLTTGTYIITNRRHRNAATLLNSNDHSSIVACNREGDRGELVRCNTIYADTQLTPCVVVC
jgi:hypothetical protein